MKRHKYFVIILTLVLLIIPSIVSAQFTGIYNAAKVSTEIHRTTMPFGGKIITTTIPTVTCLPALGTGPLVLTSNLVAVGNVVAAQFDKNTGGRIFGTINGVYNAIPLYSESPTAIPQANDWILGRHDLIPDLSTCQMTAFGAPVPFPVLKTSLFGLSNHSGF